MLTKKAVGRGSATRKYDLLTILGTYALSQDRSLQRQTLRLICLITARYNWQHDQLSVGQAEIARLWSVDPRTVKREMAAFRDRGWLVEKRAAARGRVTLYGLGIARILEDTRPVWERVGPDLTERLAAPEAPVPEAAAATGATIIPFPTPQVPAEDTRWGQLARRLLAQDAAVFGAWFAGLQEVPAAPGELVLKAPNAFHASYIKTHLLARIEAVSGPGLTIRVI
ncbi:hypothetical protein [Neotabrizicola sp. VNH66]|uniref:hypothetical protein n=1 Tax=Neotabrizicola sp. VNH66 TaxID=3400918 RepID=UPI003BFC66B0